MATRTISDTGGNYNTIGAWVEGVVPTANDDVVATVTSGPLNITASAVAKSVNLTNYVSTLTHGAFNWTIGNATGGSLLFVSGMTYIPTASTSCKITLVSNTVCNITTAGKTIRNLTINSTSGTGSFTLQDNLSITTTLLLTQGTLNNSLDFNISATTISLPGGTFNAGAGNHTFVSWAGSAANSFSSNGSTINFSGGGVFNADPPSPFNNLTISGTLSILMDFEVDGIFTLNPDAMVTFTAGIITTLLGTITMSGTSGHLVTIKSNSSGSTFDIVGDGVSNYSFSWMNITDSATDFPTSNWNAINSIDGGGNIGWSITGSVTPTNHHILNNLLPAKAKSILNYILPFKLRLNHPHQN